jgi:hypothetical protein
MRSRILLMLLIGLFVAACGKDAFAPPSARKKPPATPAAKPVEAAPAAETAPAPETFAALQDELAKKVAACQKGYLDRFDYAQLDTGLPPVPVNEFDSACKDPILKLYEKLDEKFAGRSPVADDWLAATSLLADQVFMLSGMLKNLGSRRLSALVQRMRAVEKEARATADQVRTTPPPTDDATWPAYATLAATSTPEQAFELARGRASALTTWLEERIVAHLKKDEVVYYLSWTQRLKQLRKTALALPTMERKAEIDALLLEWSQMEKLLDGDFQDHKEPVLDQAKTLRQATDALTKKR